ncbi:MAG: DinB family protein [Acidimicrobiia bacterium]|nr:DinB family protein [Acidimicrobiia bacterium]
MTTPLLHDAFGHHVWATIRLLDVCGSLGPEQLETGAEGTFGSIIDTLRHIVGADSAYLYALTGGQHPLADVGNMGPAAMRSVMENNLEAWQSLTRGDLDPDTNVIRYHDDGSENHAPLGIRLAQALHHGTDHRSQVCTVLTTLGVEPPAIDVWDYADKDGRLAEITPTP